MKVQKIKNSTTDSNLVLPIVILILVVLLSIDVSAECPPDCSVQSPAYTYGQFQNDFVNNPILAAQNHPLEYLRYIQENRQAVAEHPGAYERVIELNIRYLDQDKEAFKMYAQTLGATFKSIEGEITSFDTLSSRIETKKGSFSFEDVIKLESQGNSNFRIDAEGKLIYDFKLRDKISSVTVEGKVGAGEFGVFVTEGRVSVPAILGDTPIDLKGGNMVRLPGCLTSEDKSCSSLKVEIKENTPMILPTGILLKGKALIEQNNKLELDEGSKFQNKEGTIFEVSKKTMITEEIGTPCEKITFSCIQDSVFKPDNVLRVAAKEGNNIKIQAQDGNYKNIIVKKIKFTEPRVLVGSLGVLAGLEKPIKDIYLTPSGKLVTADGSSNDPEIERFAKIIEKHSLFAVAKNSVKYLPREKAQVDLTLIKENEQTRIIFSPDAPIIQGKVTELHTNIGHTFKQVNLKSKQEKEFSMIIHQGKVSSISQGQANEEFVLRVEQLVRNHQDEEISLFFEARDSFNNVEAKQMIKTFSADSEKLRQVLKKLDIYLINKGKSNEVRLDIKLNLLSKESIDSPAAIDLQRTLLSETEFIPSHLIKTFLLATSEREELQKEVLKKVDEINDPGPVLQKVSSDELRKMIIEKTKIVKPNYGTQLIQGIPITGRFSYSPLQEYLNELKKLDLSLQKQAIAQLNFDSGGESNTFSEKYSQGESFRRLLDFYKDEPQYLSVLLERMPSKSELGFEPQEFGVIYLDHEFQEKTKELDFATKYSIAYTAQHHLTPEEILSSDKRAEAVNLILQQREHFSKQIILDENTHYIPITNDEEMFSNTDMVRIARDSGVTSIADQNLKGEVAKEKFLEFVEQSKDKGKTTIHFNAHGDPDYQWLSQPKPGDPDYQWLLQSKPLTETKSHTEIPQLSKGINYVELGNALAQRGNLKEVTIMFDSCYSKDFTDKLYNYLYAVKGKTELPTIITETNRGQIGLGNTFNEAIKTVHSPGTPLTGKDILQVESKTFLTQDLTVTTPIITEDEAKFSTLKTPGIIDFGSTYDDGVAEPPQKPPREPSDEKPLPPTVIEIGKNEQDIEEKLAVS